MAAITKKDVFDAFNEFYQKVLEPRFDRIEKRLDGHDEKFHEILQHFDEQRVSTLQRRAEDLEKRLKTFS